jgi:NADH:ubiquinone oxidoreductase subunit 5 (subunit L)/multisubunit Na+/H+ antiporter MnhA subunit
MTNDIAVLLAVFAPTVGSFALPLVGRMSVQFRQLLALALVCISLVASLTLIPSVIGGTTTQVHLALPVGMSMVLSADALAVFMAVVSSLISAIIVLYSFTYISHYGHQDEYYFMVVLFLGAMMGLVYSANLILLYVFWEITAVASWRLIGFFREDYQVRRANKAFLVTVFGALAMLVGFISIYVQTGSFDMTVAKTALKGAPLPGFAVLLILLGILSKSATLPFHTWLPDAGVAPSPVTALLHAAVLVKIGVYVFARLFVATFNIGPDWHTVVLVVAAASALISAGAAMLETDLKRLIAYSTVSQIAFIFLGLASGSEMGVAGALLYILMHGLAKGGLFLCAGIVEQNTHTKDITKLGGLIRTMPITAASFLLCAFSVMGVPPFGGFFSKYMVISGAISGGQPWIAMVFLIGAFMTIMYLLRVFNLVFLGEEKMPGISEKSPTMVGCVAALAFLSFLGGILIHFPLDFAAQAAHRMIGMTP